jgi:hypothetical protein
MRSELAVYRSGRYVSNWPAVLVIGLIVGLVAGVGYATTRLLLGGGFSFISILFAVALSIGVFAALSIRKCYMLQPEYAAKNRRVWSR